MKYTLLPAALLVLGIQSTAHAADVPVLQITNVATDIPEVQTTALTTNIPEVQTTDLTTIAIPPAPTNLRLNFYNLAGGDLLWDRVPGAFGIVGYEVTLNGELLGTFDTLSYREFSLEPDTPYTFTVTAIDRFGMRSDAAILSVPADPSDTIPTAPGNLRTNIYNTSTGVELLWDRSNDDRGVRGYEVTLNGDVLGIFDALNYFDPNLSVNEYHYFTVTAIDTAGQRSPMVRITIGQAGNKRPSRPANVRAKLDDMGGGTLSWDASTDERGVTGYQVTVNGVVRGTFNALSYYDPSLQADTYYYFTVVAMNANWIRSIVAGTGLVLGMDEPDTVPSTPTNLRVQLYNNYGGELLWDRSTDDRGVKGYEVTVNGENRGIVDALNYYDRSLQPNTAYTFSVAAVDSADQRSPIATTSLSKAEIDPDANILLTSVGTGSPLSLSNSRQFLPAMFKIVNADPAVAVNTRFIQVYKEALNAFQGDDSRFVAQSSSDFATTFDCPDGGTYVLTDADNSDRDTHHAFEDCRVDDISLNGFVRTLNEDFENPDNILFSAVTHGDNGPLTMGVKSGTNTTISGHFDNLSSRFSWRGFTEIEGEQGFVSLGNRLTLLPDREPLEMSFEAQGTLTNNRPVSGFVYDNFTKADDAENFTKGMMIVKDTSPTAGQITMTAEPEQTTSFSIEVNTDGQTVKYRQEWSDIFNFRSFSATAK